VLAIPLSPQEWQNPPLSQGCFLVKGWCAEPSRLAPQGRSLRSVSLALRELSHPCIFKLMYAREVKDTSQDGEGESGPALKAKSLFRRYDPLTILHRDRTVSEASLQNRDELAFTRMIQFMRLTDANLSVTKKR